MYITREEASKNEGRSLLGTNDTVLNVRFEIQLMVNVHAQVLNSFSI